MQAEKRGALYYEYIRSYLLRGKTDSKRTGGQLQPDCGFGGKPQMGQSSGYALNCCPASSDIPCHRVVTKDGRLSGAFERDGKNLQKEMLRKGRSRI